MTLRKATLRDLPHLVIMARHFHRAVGIEWKFEPDRMRAFLQNFIGAPDTLALVVDRHGVAFGMIGATFAEHAWFAGRLATIWGLWVEPEMRTIRVVREMLRAFEDECARRDVRMAAITCQVKAPRVGKLFERVGFKPAETHYMKVY